MGVTPRYALPWPELNDVADAPDGFEDLAAATEAALGGVNDALTTTQTNLAATNTALTTTQNNLNGLALRTDKAAKGYGSPIIGNVVGGALRCVIGRVSAVTDAWGHVVCNFGSAGFGAIYGWFGTTIDQGGVIVTMVSGGLSGEQVVAEFRSTPTGGLLINSFVHFSVFVYGT